VTTEARPHNHQFCPVVTAIVQAAAAGGEPWGTRHEWHVTTEDAATQARTGFYAARYCREIARELGEPASVQSQYESEGQTWLVWVRVWPRSVARAEVARRVKDGERLAYNIMRSE
jgi:hypothetical protein